MTARLAQIAPWLEDALTTGSEPPPRFAADRTTRQTLHVAMRDGTLLATDLHLPPDLPAPAILIRTPYGRGRAKLAAAVAAFVSQGFVVVAQDCRGTGDSQPDHWDYYVHEREDSFDCVAWVSTQPWQDGFLAGCGGSYVGQTQWAMALHPAMSAIAPEMSGLGVAKSTADLHMFLNAYARTVGRGAAKLAISYADLEREMLDETLATGLYDAPLEPETSPQLHALYPALTALPAPERRRALWLAYCALEGKARAAFVRAAVGSDEVTISEVEALRSIFGPAVPHDAHSIAVADPVALAGAIVAAPLLITGWYDWGLNDALTSWSLLQTAGRPRVKDEARLIISPGSHNGTGFHEGEASHPALRRAFRTEANVALLTAWYRAVATGQTAIWPRVSYYLMGANLWCHADAWPPPETRPERLYLGSDGRLLTEASEDQGLSRYRYDPADPTPTIGGSILSNVYSPGSVDVSRIQERSDIQCFTGEPLEHDHDMVGPLTMILFASSSARDTDFTVRLSDVAPDGRAIQIQSGMLRARHREDPPSPLEPGRIYCFDIDLWATAHRFAAGHRIRIDVASADFPRFNRNANRGGEGGPPLVATQTIFHGGETASHLRYTILPAGRA